ncbi:MAG: tRNA pseudouridine(38-40) synthase TruA, partial [Bacteroidales bacterium]|nr:tRNA pseudouridine(38-40) synthase TruA [Bacteroidales bacterium]
IAAKDRGAAGESAPAHALFLEKVEYPEEIWI